MLEGMLFGCDWDRKVHWDRKGKQDIID